MKRIVILGSTGSIGKQTLEVVDEQPSIEVVGLTANNSIDLLEEQINRYHPKAVAVMNPEKAKELRRRISGATEVLEGIEGLCDIATMTEADVVVTAVVGMIGLRPTVAAIRAGKDIALANKETLVTAGALIMPMIKEYGVKLLPVDSEHSAIFQSMNGEAKSDIESIIITASGGPFRGYSKEQLMDVTLEQALKHPNWSMGAKITVDSSTLVNKGLEVIEAKWLFDLTPEQIQVVVHPQSIIHSLVEYVDGSIIAQLGYPDMKLPIQYALGYPSRMANNYRRLKLADIGQLTFEEPDRNLFKGLDLAFESLKAGGTMSVVYNAANEAAVGKFLNREIKYHQISEAIEAVMLRHNAKVYTSVDEVIEAERWTYEQIEKVIK